MKFVPNGTSEILLTQYEIRCAYEICLRHMKERILFHIFAIAKIFHNPLGLFHIGSADISLFLALLPLL